GFLLAVAAHKRRPEPPEPTPEPSPPKPTPSAPSSLDINDQPWVQRNAADEAAKTQIAAEQADLKKRKTTGRIAKLKANQSGETKQMPLEPGGVSKNL